MTERPRHPLDWTAESKQRVTQIVHGCQIEVSINVLGMDAEGRPIMTPEMQLRALAIAELLKHEVEQALRMIQICGDRA